MKKVIYILCLLLLVTAFANAQVPQPIKSFAKVRFSTEWYKTQLKLWKKEVDKNQKNANAWYNYFKVKRILIMHDEDDSTAKEIEDKELALIVENMSKAIPNTFEYHHAAWIQTGLGDMSKLHHLEKALEMQPDNPAIFTDIINISELQRDTVRRDLYSKKLYNDPETSPGFLYYCYNMMVGIDKNAILVTVGDNDTYPVWMLQAERNLRKNIIVINTSLIMVKEYREKLFNELGIENIKYDPFESEETLKRFEKELLPILASNNKNRPVYIAVTIGKKLIEWHWDKVYLTGLCFQYSEEHVDVYAKLRKNYEQNYLLDYLFYFNRFFHDISEDLVTKINFNYLLSMGKLAGHYFASGEVEKGHELMMKVGRGNTPNPKRKRK